MVVKSKLESEHINNLGNIFEILKRHKLRLKASNCSFGVRSGKFLGYMKATTSSSSKEHSDAIKEKVNKLKQVVTIKEVFYPKWLANIVLVDVTIGHPRMSILDAFQGYYQTPLALDDQEKTAFVTSNGNYHYKVIHFGLKNVGSTYQRMMTKIFKPQLGKNIEIYIDEMVVKSKLESEHINNLGNIFEILKRHKLRLKASNCSFGVRSGKFLGYMLKEYFFRPPIMCRPEVDEVLFAYIVVASNAVSLVLVRVDSSVQRLVYYVSKSLHEAELPLRSLLRSVDYRGRIAKWGTILRVFDIKYMSRISVKGQVLANLVAEKNEAEYEDLLVGMTMVQKMGGKAMEILSDSKLVVGQVQGELKARDLRMQEYLNRSNSEADKVWRKASLFWLSDNQKLYKRSFSGPYLLCIHPEAVELLLEELHEGICGSHTGGSFPKAAGNKRYLLADTNYFTKWVEAEPLTNIRDMDAKRFVGKNIVTRFGISHTLISYNGLQFNSKAFRRLDDAKEKWVKELPHVLYTYQTTPHKSTGDMPFSMTYGAEAVIPLETGFPMLRTSSFTLSNNDELLKKILDVIEERKENAMV
nr:uncharacterized protein LOC112032784 [Quercus suber]